MGRWGGRRRSAYYTRNGSYSRSYNAENAEADGRLPRTRAAAHLGVSVKAFDAGRMACGYTSTEWHHVGKYAAMVDYYDTNTLEADPEFWKGCAEAYASKKKKAELMARHAEGMESLREERFRDFRAKLVRQRDCTRYVHTHGSVTSRNWDIYCGKAGLERGFIHLRPMKGDKAGLRDALHVQDELKEHASYRRLLRAA